MLGRARSSRLPEDPAVAPIERILEAVASRDSGEGQVDVPPTAPHALWICACVGYDDAPTWLISDGDDEGIAWRRVPEGVEPLDLVVARQSAGGHAEPAAVLLWLERKAPAALGEPRRWPGSGRRA